MSDITTEYSQYSERFKTLFWDNFVRDKEYVRGPAFFTGLLESKNQIEELINSPDPIVKLMSGGRRSGKSAALEYITLQRALKRSDKHGYVAWNSRMAHTTIDHIHEWIKRIDMESRILRYTENEIFLDNGSQIIVTTKKPYECGTIVYDSADSLSDDFKDIALVPPLLATHINATRGSIFLAADPEIPMANVFSHVGVKFRVEDIDLFGILERIKINPNQIEYIKNYLQSRKVAEGESDSNQASHGMDISANF